MDVLAKTYFITEHKIIEKQVVVKDLIVTAVSKEGEIKQANLEFWLKRISYNVIRDFSKQEKRLDAGIQRLVSKGFCPSPEEAAPSIEDENIDECQKDILQKALEKLSRKDREIILFRYIDDLDWKEIGKRLNISTAASRKRGQRALGRLREEFFSFYPVSDKGGES